jgi:hypothetical protein
MDVETSGLAFHNAGVNFLIPQAWEVSWTRLDDGCFNEYPDIDAWKVSEGGAGDDDETTFGQAIPIPGNVRTDTAIIGGSGRRGFILIQNNSTATSPDTPATLYVGYDGPINLLPLGLNLSIPPGSGLVLDRRVPSNSIYVKWAGASGGSAVTCGVIHQGLKPVR